MSAPSFPFKTGSSVLVAAGLGLTAGFLLRPESPPLSRNPPLENAIPRLAKDSPLGRRHTLPQTEARLETLRKAGSPSQQIAAALAFAEIGSVQEIRDLLENAHRFPAHSAEEAAIGTLLKRWLELDAAGAVDYCGKNQAEFLPKLLANWSHDYPAEATAWVRAMPPGTAQRNAWLGLCSAEAVRDPDKAWDMLGRTPGVDPRMGGIELQISIRALVERDVEKALANLETMPPSMVDSAQQAIAVQLMKTDPARAWAWALQYAKNNETLGAALAGALKYQPAKAMDFLNSLPDGDLKGVIHNLPGDVFFKDPAVFASSLLQDTGLTESSKTWLAARFFHEILGRHPATAETLLPLLEKEAGGATYADQIANFFKDNPQSAMSWLERLPEGPLRTAALEAQAKFAPAEKSPGRTGPESLADEIKRNGYIQPTDPRLAQLTTEQLGEIMKGGRAEENFYRETQLLIHLGAANSALATAWLESTPIDAKTGPIAARFSAQWAETDPTAAAAWVVKLPAGDLARTAAANVARHYQRYAPEMAAAWAAQLPPGPVQDAARKVMEGK